MNVLTLKAETMKAANEMTCALDLVKGLLPENGKRCDARFVVKVNATLRDNGYYAKFWRNTLSVYKSAGLDFFAQFGADVPCASFKIASFDEAVKSGIMRNVDYIREDIEALKERCRTTANKAAATTAEGIDAFCQRYNEIYDQFCALRKSAPFGVSWMMDNISICPIR